MNNLALVVKNLTYSYDKEKDVVNDVSLTIKRGSYVSIIGHNGSGKSTFAKLIAGLLEPQAGEIYIFDLLLNDKNLATIRRDLGIVFQNPDNQFIGSSVRDDIAFGLENRQVPSDQMDAIIEHFASEVNMSAFLDKEPTNLSGGQKQRVAIAGVLALSPKIVILDEATAMLDPRGKREIGEIVKRMKLDNPDLTVISITHDIEETLGSDEIIVFNAGKIILQGTPSQVYKNAEVLHAISLDLPFIYRLKEALEKEGLTATSNDLESLAGELWQ
jgi:energy-coupling factor transport system ATP-binding protein